MRGEALERRPLRRKDWLLFLAGMLGAVALICLSAWTVEQTWIRPSVQPPPEGAFGRTQWGGMIPELRNPPRIVPDNDPYYWVSYARQSVATGQWRIRRTEVDNVPYGREVHWNSGFIGYLIICGIVAQSVTGGSLSDAIEVGSLFANPVLLLVVLLVTGSLVMKRFGGVAAAAWVIALPALSAVMWDFGYAHADHHGMHDLAALGLMLGLCVAGVGLVRSRDLPEAVGLLRYWPTEKQARRGIVFSAVCGAIGLWVGATQQIFVLTAAGIGWLGAIALAKKPDAGLRFEPKLIRIWGRVGCAGSLFFFLWEYFPQHMAMRLEVNHPVYALAWLGASEVLFQIARWRIAARRPQGRDLIWLGLGLMAAILPALLLTLGPMEWHAWRDPFMRRQHNYINEFEPFSHTLRTFGYPVIYARFGLLPLGILLGLVILLSRGVPRALKTLILIPLAASVICGTLLFAQVRWGGFLSISLAVLALISTHYFMMDGNPIRHRRIRGVAAGVVGLLFLAPVVTNFFLGFRDSFRQAQMGVLDPYLAWIIASRDVALNLKRIAASEPVRVMSGPGQTPALHYFGGVHGTGSLYWENIEGVRDAAAFFADQGDAVAKKIARQRGITHVVVQQTPELAIQSCGIWFGHENETEIRNSLAYRLSDPLGVVPDWLEPVPYYGSPMAADYQMRIYRVLSKILNE